MLGSALLVAWTILAPTPDPARPPQGASTVVTAKQLSVVTDAVRVGDYTPLRDLIRDKPEGDILGLLFVVFKGSLEDQHADKKYFLQKLAMFKQMGEQLSDYLHELANAEASSEGRPVTKAFVVVDLDDELQLLVPAGDRTWTKAELRAEIARVKRLRADLRKRRRKASRPARAAGVTPRDVAAAQRLWNRLAAAARDDGEADTSRARPRP